MTFASWFGCHHSLIILLADLLATTRTKLHLHTGLPRALFPTLLSFSCNLLPVILTMYPTLPLCSYNSPIIFSFPSEQIWVHTPCVQGRSSMDSSVPLAIMLSQTPSCKSLCFLFQHKMSDLGTFSFWLFKSTSE